MDGDFRDFVKKAEGIAESDPTYKIENYCTVVARMIAVVTKQLLCLVKSNLFFADLKAANVGYKFVTEPKTSKHIYVALLDCGSICDRADYLVDADNCPQTPLTTPPSVLFGRSTNKAVSDLGWMIGCLFLQMTPRTHIGAAGRDTIFPMYKQMKAAESRGNPEQFHDYLVLYIHPLISNIWGKYANRIKKLLSLNASDRIDALNFVGDFLKQNAKHLYGSSLK